MAPTTLGHGSGAGDRTTAITAAAIAVAGALLFVRHVATVWDVTVDDAYIVFRYAQNLVAGAEPTFNAEGPPAEGVTQMLWLVLMAVPHLLSLDPEPFAKVLGVSLSVATWGLVLALAVRAGEHAGLPLGPRLLAGGIAVAALAALPFTALHAVAGLGTALFAFLVLVLVRACTAFAESPTGRSAAMVGATGLLLGLARPEGNAFAAMAYATLLVVVPRAVRGKLLRGVATWHVAPGAAWFAGRWIYYGLPMPLPYYVKMQSADAFGAAADSGVELALRMTGYLAPVWGPLVLVGLGWVRRPIVPGVVAALGFVAVQTFPQQLMGYGWRYFFPVLPVLAVVAGLGAARAAVWCERRLRRRWLAIGIALALGGATIVAGARGREPQLAPWVTYARGLERAHLALGDRLAAASAPSSERTLSISDAGAVPYRSGWHTIDTFGLNNPDISVRGVRRTDLVMSARPEVIVLISTRGDEFAPPLPWEAEIRDAALRAAYEVVTVLEFRADYFLWVLCPNGSPVGQDLERWQRRR